MIWKLIAQEGEVLREFTPANTLAQILIKIIVEVTVRDGEELLEVKDPQNFQIMETFQVQAEEEWLLKMKAFGEINHACRARNKYRLTFL